MSCNDGLTVAIERRIIKMLSRYYDTIRTPMFDLIDPLRVFSDLETTSLRHRSDTIDDEGIKIELPGVKAEDVEVTLDGRSLKVSGKTRHGREFSYSYSLKPSVDDSAVTASLKDGLLSISLPLKQESTSRKIQIIS